MSSVKYFASFTISVLLWNYVLGNSSNALESWMETRITALENAVQRAGCQRYLARGYRYEHMYRIDGVAFDNTKVIVDNDDLKYFEMHLAIKTAKDGIILLSPTRNPGRDDLVFEFAVGIDYGVITVLRLRKEGLIGVDEVARVRTSQLVTTAKYTQFYIILDNDVLTFGKEGEEPIITYSDVRLKLIKYFDISSYGRFEAKYLYDCPAPTQKY